jgi:integrase
MAAARAEDRRRLAALSLTGWPDVDPESPVSAAPATPSPAPSEVQKHDDTPSKKSFPMFSDVAKDYFESYAITHLKPSTRRGYAVLVKAFLNPRIGRRAINEIDLVLVNKLDRELVERKYKASSRLQVQAVLRSILRRYATEVGLLPEAPTFPRLPKVGRRIVTALTEEEFGKILGGASRVHRLAFLLAAHAGLRAGEVRGLLWRDVDLVAGHLVVRESVSYGERTTPKSGHERVVPLTKDLREALEAVSSRSSRAPVSLCAREKAWSEHGLRQAFGRACKRAGLESWRFHDLRHYFVTALFRVGVAAPTVQALAGHAHLTTTQRYAHVARVDLAAAIDRLSNVG